MGACPSPWAVSRGALSPRQQAGGRCRIVSLARCFFRDFRGWRNARSRSRPAYRHLVKIMSGRFDPYHAWLNIPPHEQPPHYYRLLTLRLFEPDPAVIEAAANDAIARVQYFAGLPGGEYAPQMLAQLAQAGRCLLDPVSRHAYDQQLYNWLNAAQAAAQPQQYAFAAAQPMSGMPQPPAPPPPPPAAPLPPAMSTPHSMTAPPEPPAPPPAMSAPPEAPVPPPANSINREKARPAPAAAGAPSPKASAAKGEPRAKAPRPPMAPPAPPKAPPRPRPGQRWPMRRFAFKSRRNRRR